ncbi:DUF3515 family protein [Streptomyces sp. SID14515]|uniref:DUF3515 family protein n=1 Tax=Streptomyces sp. SID14515 TaxID=2706074 RepID=UPI0013CB8CF3|nr:DUF3515 family protein [Streptomyces sp. SID14515]NEB41097.1 DUF3515 family protein [Streptomyces sp. SID14515]
MTSNTRGALRLTAALTVCTAALAGCGSGDGYNLTKPPYSGSPACGTLTGKLPGELGGYGIEKSQVTGAAAWGDGGDIILYCGMPEPEAGAECTDEGGVGWVAQKPADDRTAKMFATRGRTPGVQVRIRNESVEASAVLSALAPAVKEIEADRPCGATD